MFNCSIQSNSEYIYLTWEIAFPGESPVEFTFDNSSTQNVMMDYGVGISAVFTDYTIDEYIESNMVVTVLRQNVNETVVTCQTDVQNSTQLALFDISGTPLDVHGRIK